jgi:hypothetical protein
MKLNDWEVRERVGVKVTPGQIDVSEAYVALMSDSLIIVEISCRSKYPEVGPVSSDVLYLVATENTLYKVNSEETTLIELRLPEGFEIGPTEVGRYHVALFCYKRNERNAGTIIWRNK